MSEIEALQGRIMAALDRIGEGVESIRSEPAPQDSDNDDAAQLRQELEDERLANAQLEERVKSLSSRVRQMEEAGQSAEASRDTSDATRKEAMRRMDAELQALRLANQQLRDNNAALREANETGVVEPHLINKAMMAELDGLRAARAADRAEMDLVLAELDQTLANSNGAADDAPRTEDI